MNGTLSDSFEFRGINFRDEFGVRIIKTDFILPPKRERKLHIPKRHGRYDYGAKNWEERVIRIECDITKKLSRADLREISYVLSKKGKLFLWDEPDKFYIGEIYQGGEIFDYPKQNIRNFILEFTCEPFAYRESQSFDVTSDEELIIDYMGTEESPCIIQLEANGRTAQNITITHLIRR